MTWLWRGLILGIATLATVAALRPEPSYSKARERPQRQVATRELHQQESRVRRSRRVTRQILADPKASEDIKRQATELDQLLANREQVIANLESLHRDFVARHQADLAELAELRRRALDVDGRLRAARDEVLRAHVAEIKELRSSADRIDTLVGDLGDAYGRTRRERHGNP